jgi:hypothetical protein
MLSSIELSVIMQSAIWIIVILMNALALYLWLKNKPISGFYNKNSSLMP